MGRIPRIVIPGFPHHVTQRGNRRQQTFFCDEDFEAYIKFLINGCSLYNVEILAYCLMMNHIHLVAVPSTTQSLSQAIGDAHRKYTLLVNQKKGWAGYLWQGRFFSTPLDSSHFIRAVRYIELNPVRAGIVEDPTYYRWSSARMHCGEGVHDLLVKPTTILSDCVGDWHRYLTNDDNDDFSQLRLNTRTGRPLGSKKFIEQLKRINQISHQTLIRSKD